MDISHGIPFAHSMDIHAGTYEDIADASVVIITAGANQKPGETRLDLVQKNSRIMKGIIAEIKRVKCEGILMIVSNPVDILTEVALRESGFPKERVSWMWTVRMSMRSLQESTGTASSRCGAVRMCTASRWMNLPA